MHNFFDGTFASQAQMRRGLPSTARLHKKTRVLCAGEAGDTSRAEGVRRVYLFMPLFVSVRLCFDVVVLWSLKGMQNKSPCQRGAEGLTGHLVLMGVAFTLDQGGASIFLNGQAAGVAGAARA